MDSSSSTGTTKSITGSSSPAETANSRMSTVGRLALSGSGSLRKNSSSGMRPTTVCASSSTSTMSSPAKPSSRISMPGPLGGAAGSDGTTSRKRMSSSSAEVTEAKYASARRVVPANFSNSASTAYVDATTVGTFASDESRRTAKHTLNDSVRPGWWAKMMSAGAFAMAAAMNELRSPCRTTSQPRRASASSRELASGESPSKTRTRRLMISPGRTQRYRRAEHRRNGDDRERG